MVENEAIDRLVNLLNNQDPTPDPLYGRNAAVLWLQDQLTTMLYFAGGENSGVYDQPTFDAVAKLQEDLGLDLKASDYGLVENKTFNAILEQGATWTNPGDPVER